MLDTEDNANDATNTDSDDDGGEQQDDVMEES